MKSQACRELMSVTAALKPPSAFLALFCSRMTLLTPYGPIVLELLCMFNLTLCWIYIWHWVLSNNLCSLANVWFLLDIIKYILYLYMIYTVRRMIMCRFPVQYTFIIQSLFHVLLLGCLWYTLYYLACRDPVKPCRSNCSVKYLEGDCWLRALEQRQRLFWCSGCSVAHMLPVGMDFCIHFGLCTAHWIEEIVLSSGEAHIQSLKHVSSSLSLVGGL